MFAIILPEIVNFDEHILVVVKFSEYKFYA